MFTIVVTLLATWVGAAVISTVTGLFWLTLVALVGLLFTGAVGVSMRTSPGEDAAPLSSAGAVATSARRSGHLRSVPVNRTDLQPRRSPDAARPQRAA